MSLIRGIYLAVNKMNATSDSTISHTVNDIQYTGDLSTNQVCRIYANDSSNNATLVWDLWNTVLEANDFNIGSAGGNVTDYANISSYGTDIEGGNHLLNYSCSPTTISANYSENNVTHSVYVTQPNTNKQLTVTATQAGRRLSSTTYSTPSVTSTSISSVHASGNVTRYLTVGWSQTKTLIYDNGTTSSSTVTGSSTATITNGSSSVGAYINGGGIYVPSAGTTIYTSDHIAYTISQFNFVANGISSGTVYRTVYLYRGANTATTTWGSYNLSISASTNSIAYTGGNAVISATTTRNYTDTFTSGASSSGAIDAVATVSSTLGTFNTTGKNGFSITGSGSSTLTIPENTGGARTITVTVSTGDYNKSVYIEQAGKPAPVSQIGWDVYSGYFVYSRGAYEFGATLIYNSKIEGYTVFVEVFDGNYNSIISSNIELTKSGTNGDRNTMQIVLSSRDIVNTDVCYMRASYGSDTAEVQLTKQ